MFLDEVELSVSSGRGGSGSASLRREKFVPRGGPDGGDGGRGGDVVAVADPAVGSLQAYQTRRSHRAGDGGAGGSARRHGAEGVGRRLSVPPGTLVWDAGSGALLADLDRPSAEVVLAPGGRGGRGNIHFASPSRQAPRRRELGGPRVERRIRLELRLIADLGLVGLPNAGKSTLLGRLTGARPQVAAYPFTTLSPNLGVAELGRGRVLTIADLPGLIEGAHRGAGLGLGFLRHASRTRALIHVVDLSEGREAAAAGYQRVAAELAAYSPELAAELRIVALNKIDLLQDADGASAWVAQHLAPVPVRAISAATGAGCAEMLAAAAALAKEANPGRAAAATPAFRLYQGPRGLSRQFQVHRDGDRFRVDGEGLDELVAASDLDDDAAVLRLQRRLRRLGVEAALARAGAASEDEVEIGGATFTFYPDADPADGRRRA